MSVKGTKDRLGGFKEGSAKKERRYIMSCNSTNELFGGFEKDAVGAEDV